MFKLLFLIAAGYLIYLQWFRPSPRIEQDSRTHFEDDTDEFISYEEIIDE